MKHWTSMTLSLLTLVILVGCGQSTENKLETAELALVTNKPDKALQLAERVLRREPNHVGAFRIKAMSHMRLQQLAVAKPAAEKLIELAPEDPDARNVMIEWCFLQANKLLKKADFTTRQSYQEQLAETLGTARDQANWLSMRDGSAGDAFYLKARLTDIELHGVDLLLSDAEETLRRGVPGEGLQSKTGLQAKRRRLIKQAKQFLREAIALRPDHYEAHLKYANMLKLDSAWPDLWLLAYKLSHHENIPGRLADELVVVLLQMPSSFQPRRRRVETAERILQVVAEDQQQQNDYYIASARLHLVKQEPEQAMAALKIVMARDAQHTNARYLLAQAHYGMKQFEEAKQILDRLSTQVRQSDDILTLYGMTLMETGDIRAAQDVLAHARELNPDNLLAQEKYLQVVTQGQMLPEATEDVLGFYKANPKKPRAIRMMVQLLQARGRANELRNRLGDEVAAIKPLTKEILVIMISGYFYLEEFGEAETYAKKLVDLVPESMAARLRLAEAMIMLNKQDEVRKMLNGLRNQFPDIAGVNQLMGRLYLRRQRYVEAERWLTKVIEAEPENSAARLLMARTLANRSLTDQSLDQIDKVLEESPNHLEAHALAARIYQFMGEEVKANEHLAYIDPNEVDENQYPALLAQIKMKLGELDMAADICNRAIGAGSTEPALRLILAQIYTSQEKYKRAEVNLLALVRSQPSNPQTYALLTRFYVQRREFDRGLAEFDRLRADTGQVMLNRMSRAVLYRALKKLPQAARELELVYEPLIEQREQSVMAVADALGRVHLAANDKAAALATYQKLIDADFLAAEGKLRQVDVMMSHGDIKAAVEALGRLGEQFTELNRRVRVQVLRRYVQMEQMEKAMPLLDRWIEQDGEKMLLVRWLGDLLLRLKRPIEAQQAFRRAIEVAPTSLALYQRLAQAHAAAYDYPGAAAALDEMSAIHVEAKMVSLAAKGKMFLRIGLAREALATFSELERSGEPRDPNVIFAIGQAFMDMDKPAQARSRLERIPVFAARFPDAQLLIAQIEQEAGKAEDAHQRVRELLARPRVEAATATSMLGLDFRDEQNAILLGWADELVNLQNLPVNLRFAWMGVRVTLYGIQKDWERMLKALGVLGRSRPNASNAAAQLAVLLYLNRPQQAADVYRATAELADGPLGPITAMLVDEQITVSGRESSLSKYLRALANQQVDLATQAVATVHPRVTFYRSDLLSILDRGDIQAPVTAKAVRDVALAAVAVESNLPHFAEHLCLRAIRRVPTMVPAYSLLIQVKMQLGKPTEAIRDQLAATLPDSALGLYLSADHHRASGDYAAAARLLRALLEREPQHYAIEYELAQALQSAEKADEALSLLEAIVASGSPFANLAKNDLAYMLAERPDSRLDEAFQLAANARANIENPALNDTIGWIEHLRGNQQIALTELNRALVKLAGVQDVHYHLGKVYNSLNRKRWARYHLEQSLDGPDRPWSSEVRGLLQ